RPRVRSLRGARRRLRPGGHSRARRAARRDAQGRVAERGGHDAQDRGAGTLSIRVLIVDDHAVVRSGLRLLLEGEEDIEVAGEAGTAREAILEARSAKPDLVLMDVTMPDGSGLDAVPTLLHEHEGIKVLVLSMQDDPRYVREAFTVG